MRVIFKSSHGSIGTSYEEDGNGRPQVIWNHGKDAKGEFILGRPEYPTWDNLVEVSEELYHEYINCEAWSEEQKVVRKKILDSLKAGTGEAKGEKDCQDCEYWCADPDSAFCGHPDALKISPYGINLRRMRGDLAFRPADKNADPGFNLCKDAKLWKERSPERKLTSRK